MKESKNDLFFFDPDGQVTWVKEKEIERLKPEEPLVDRR